MHVYVSEYVCVFMCGVVYVCMLGMCMCVCVCACICE